MVNESVWSETPNHGCNINGTTTANGELNVNTRRVFKSVDDLVQ